MEHKKEITRQYSNGEVTIVWKPGMCIHSANCVNGLPGVFNINAKPWINSEGATSDEIVNQVKACPSGALTFFMNEGSDTAEEIKSAKIEAEVFKNGPLMISGDISIKDGEGNIIEKEKKAFFCRCGASNNKPFCDGAHKKIGFEG